jgi:hypothetical protein
MKPRYKINRREIHPIIFVIFGGAFAAGFCLLMWAVTGA